MTLKIGKAAGSTSRSCRDQAQVLGEGFADTRAVQIAEATCHDPDLSRASLPRQVAQNAGVAAVQALGLDASRQADHRLACLPGLDVNTHRSRQNAAELKRGCDDEHHRRWHGADDYGCKVSSPICRLGTNQNSMQTAGRSNF